jgi:hypothetical protein
MMNTNKKNNLTAHAFGIDVGVVLHRVSECFAIFGLSTASTFRCTAETAVSAGELLDISLRERKRLGRFHAETVIYSGKKLVRRLESTGDKNKTKLAALFVIFIGNHSTAKAILTCGQAALAGETKAFSLVGNSKFAIG